MRSTSTQETESAQKTTLQSGTLDRKHYVKPVLRMLSLAGTESSDAGNAGGQADSIGSGSDSAS